MEADIRLGALDIQRVLSTRQLPISKVPGKGARDQLGRAPSLKIGRVIIYTL